MFLCVWPVNWPQEGRNIPMTAQSSRGSATSLLPPGSSAESGQLEMQTQIGTKPRILYVVAEHHALETVDITNRVQAEAQAVLAGGKFSPGWERVLRPLGAWSYAVLHGVRDLYLIDDVAAATGLKYVSVVSAGKSGCSNPSPLRRVIENTTPDLIVCAGGEAVYWPLVGTLGLSHELLTTAFGEPIYYSQLETRTRASVLLHFWHPAQGDYIEGGHEYLFKLFLHAYDALCRKRLLECH
jgi:hypothetical protein